MVTNNLRSIRMKQGVAQSTLARKTKLSQSQIYDIENNEVGNILYTDKQLIEIVCNLFKITEVELFNKPAAKKEVDIKTFFANQNKAPKYLFLDSSTIMNHKYFAQKFLKYFTKLCIVPEVQDELNYHKESRNTLKSDKGNDALREMGKYKEFIEFDFDKVDKITRDEKIYYTAYEYAQKHPNIDIYFVSDDKVHTSKLTKLKNLTILKGKEFNSLVHNGNKNYNNEETKMFWTYLKNQTLSSLMRMDLEKIDLNSMNEDDITPLCFALSNKLWDIAELLIKRLDVDLNTVGCSPMGYGAIHYAVNANHLRLVKLLDDQGAYLDLLSKHAIPFNVTPLMIASSKGNVEIVEYLLSRGVSINQQDTEGNTSAHRAAYNKHFNICEMLIEEGIDTNIINSNYERIDEINKKD